jgi:histidinol-phosphatase (PHP family)
MSKHLFNLHTHCHYCDGSSAPEEYVKEAIRQGFHTLGFSSHAPVPFENKFAIQSESKLVEYADEIRSLKLKYKKELNIFLASEMDFIPGITSEFAHFNKLAGLDYVIGGVHLLKHPAKDTLWFIDGPRREIYDDGLRDIFDGDIQLAVKTYWRQIREMINTQSFDIVAHLDKIKMHNQNRFFTENEPWYQQELLETLQLIAKKEIIVEVNTRGIYKGRSEELFPGIDALKKILDFGIPITLNSDAHLPEDLSKHFPEARVILKKIGFKKIRVFTKDGWSETNV